MLAPGTRLGAYEVVAPLDAGGMGECIASPADSIDTHRHSCHATESEVL
jgi:hypothetical protein